MEHFPEIMRRDGTLFFACPGNSRSAIATSIERLIDLLDAMDGDTDFEQSGDSEPDLGAPERHPETSCRVKETKQTAAGHSQERWSQGGDDYEPTFGASVGDLHAYSPSGFYCDQSFWGRGNVIASLDEAERENEHGGDILDEPHDDDCCDDEDGGDEEYSLGWLETGVQLGDDGGGDREHDEGECGDFPDDVPYRLPKLGQTAEARSVASYSATGGAA